MCSPLNVKVECPLNIVVRGHVCGTQLEPLHLISFS